MSEYIKTDSVKKVLCSLLTERGPSLVLPDEIAKDPELSAAIHTLYDIRGAFSAIASGDLDFSIKGKGYYIGLIKSFQASLRHLAWQTQAIASGDFTQNVDFLGGFSTSFNQMTCSLDKAMEQIKKSEKKFRLLAEYSSDMVWIYNLDRREMVYISPSVFYLLGFTPEEAMKIRTKDMLSEASYSRAKRNLIEGAHQFKTHPEERISTLLEIQQKNKRGDYLWMELSVNFRRNHAGEIEIVGSSRNIEKRKKAEEKVVYLSYHDQLTGLYNLRFFEEEFRRIDSEENLPITVVMADLNGLKLINDAFGHHAGNELIKTFSGILEKHFRPTDVIARIGGDEFVILMKNTDAPKAEKIIEKMKKSIGELSLKEIILSASFGVHTKEYAEDNLEKTYRIAENKMYHQKLKESTIMKSKTILLIHRTLYEKHDTYKAHSERVAGLCREIGEAMKLDEASLEELYLLGLFHDIGKIAISGEVLNKKEPMTEIEATKLKRHPETGYQILRSSSEYAGLADYVLSHHERIDGTGYPRGLSGDEIPLPVKVLAVAEAYDHFVNVKYEPQSPKEACAELIKEAETKYDQNVVSVFVHEVMGF